LLTVTRLPRPHEIKYAVDDFLHRDKGYYEPAHPIQASSYHAFANRKKRKKRKNDVLLTSGTIRASTRPPLRLSYDVDGFYEDAPRRFDHHDSMGQYAQMPVLLTPMP